MSNVPNAYPAITPEPTDPFGYFDSERHCYCLTGDLPRVKWRNVHFNEPGDHEFWSEVSNLGDGVMVYRDVEGATLTVSGWDKRFCYVRDDADNRTFCAAGLPVLAEMDATQTHYHAAYTEMTGRAYELQAVERHFVPVQGCFEAITLQVTNLSDRVRKVSVFSYTGFAMNGKKPDGKGFPVDVSTHLLADGRTVLARNRHPAVPEVCRHAFASTLNDLHSWTGHRDRFTHADFSLSTPQLLCGGDLDKHPGGRADCAGALQVKLSLNPGETGRVDFLIGASPDASKLTDELASWTPERLDAALQEQIEREETRSAKLTVATGFTGLDALVNDFTKKQMVFYNIFKSGFRDNLQNDMGLATVDYPLAKQNLRRALASQYPSGDVPHGFRPWNLLPYADKPAWILQCVPWVLKESGDLAFLDEEIPFKDGEDSGTVWDHILRAMRFLCQTTGAHGLCDQRFADWDDGLEPSEKTGARESVFVTQQLCLGLLEVAELARRRGASEVEAEATQQFETFKQRLNEHCWDGEWYQRTLCEGDYIAGTKANAEGQIYLYCQAWAILSQTAPKDRAESCMAAVDRMCEFDVGFSLVEPPHSVFDERIGKKSAMRPGFATNGGAYCHAAAFKAVADFMMGRGDEGFRTIRKVAPNNPANPLTKALNEPFSWTNCYDRAPEVYGSHHYPWKTGTASWMLMALVEYCLGARRHYDGLLIDPCLPSGMKSAHVHREFRGCRFDIEITNESGEGRSPKRIEVDGEVSCSNILCATKESHSVKVIV